MNDIKSLSPHFNMRTSVHPMKKVAVIGAGLAGLVTIKELLEESHSVVCFEQEGGVGGAFNRNKRADHGAYADLHLTVSNFFMSFSSFPPKDDKRRYWTADEYADYLNAFADHYKLRHCIRFNTTVLSIEPFDEETWRIVYSKDGTLMTEYVDAVAVCSGRFKQANLPRFEGMDRFKGKIHHSFNYRTADAFAGRDVVCVGVGESGSDVVHQIAKVARSAHLVVNRPKNILPRMISGNTNDAFTIRSAHYGHVVSQSLLEATFKKRLFDKRILRDGELDAFSTWKYIEQYGFHGEFSNKNDIFFQDIEYGRLQMHLFGIDHLYEDGVVLRDGTRIACSDVMLCTGYATNFDLIHHPAARDAAADIRNCLFHMVHPSLKESLVWIGFVRPDVGGVPTIAELQARYYAKLLSKKQSLPPREQLAARIASLKEREQFHFSLEPKHSENVKYYHITSELAEAIGARPRWYQLLLDPVLMLLYYHGSMVGCHYRLVGPDSNRRQAAAFIKKIGLLKAPWHEVLGEVLYASVLSALAPVHRRLARWMGLEHLNMNRKGRCASVQEILRREWPTGKSRHVDDDAPLASLFTAGYEYEGFKYFLCHHYGIPAHTFATSALKVSDINQLLPLANAMSAG